MLCRRDLRTGEIRARGRRECAGANPPTAAERPTLRHGTAFTQQTPRLPEPQSHYHDLQKGEQAWGHFQTLFHPPSSNKQGNVSTTPRQTPSEAFREAQTPGFAHLHSTNGQLGAQQRKRGEMVQEQGDSWLHRLRDEPTAPSSQPRLPQLGPSHSHPGILIAEGYKLKAPGKTWPSLAKMSEDKSKDKPSIILTLWTETGQKSWRDQYCCF